MVKTPCDSCAFKTKEGCYGGMHEKFIQKGIAVNKSGDSVFVEGTCLYYRNRDEFNVEQGKLWDAVKESVLTDYRLQVVVVITDNDLNKVIDSINALEDQTLPPTKVTFVRMPGSVKEREVTGFLQTTELNWTVYTVLNRKLTVGEGIDEAIRNSDAIMYSVFQSGFVIPKDFCEKIVKSQVEDLERYVLLKGEAGNGTTVSYLLHKTLGGNALAEVNSVYGEPKRYDSIEEKIEFVANDQKQNYLVKEVSQICRISPW